MKNVFTNRNFRLVFFGALVSEMGATLYSFAVSFYILEITGNNAFLQGLYLALCGIALLIATPIGGVLGDRMDKAKIMFVCDYLKSGLILAAALLMGLFPGNDAHLWILFILGILGNIVSGIFNPASGALLPSIVGEEQLQQANAYFSVKSALENIFAIVLAGVLYALLPIGWLFVSVGVCFFLSGVSEMFIRCGFVPKEEKLTLRLALADMKDGIRYLRAQKAIVVIMAAVLFINFFFTPIGGNFLPYFIKADLAPAPYYLFDRLLTPELWSSVFSVLIGLSSLIGSLILSARPSQGKSGLKTAVRICGVAAVLIALSFSYWLLVARGISLNAFLILFSIGCFLIGLLLVFINIPINTTLMQIVDKDQLSKVGSILSLFSQGLIPIASVAAGAVLQSLGCTWLLAICSAGITVTALIWLFNKTAREI